MALNVDELNERFGIAGQVHLVNGPGDLPQIQIENMHARAVIALQGAHVITFQPHHHQPVLWVSERAIYAPGKAIRGGIPICWPWFGQHPGDPSKPMHGFVRTQRWTVEQTTALADRTTRIELGFTDSPETRRLWPFPFRLQLNVTVGQSLDVELVAQNTGSAAFSYTGALHNYFTVGDVSGVTISGLEDTAYLDKTDEFKRNMQNGPVTISSETDRVYLDTTNSCTIEDPQLRRQIVIAKHGSRTTVVWNPWQEKARAIADFSPNEYTAMVCVETANAGDDIVTVAPGEEQRLHENISVMSRKTAR